MDWLIDFLIMSLSVGTRKRVNSSARPETTWTSRAASTRWPGLPPASTWAQDWTCAPHCVCERRGRRETAGARLPTAPHCRRARVREWLRPSTASALHRSRFQGRLHGSHVERRSATSRSERSLQRTRSNCRRLFSCKCSGAAPPRALSPGRWGGGGSGRQQHVVLWGHRPPV